MSTFPKAMFQAGPSGPKRGSGAPSTRARAFRRSQPSSRQHNPSQDNTPGNQGNMPVMRAGRGRGIGAVGARGKRTAGGAGVESSRPSQTLPIGPGGWKTQFASPFAATAATNSFSIDRAKDPRRQHGTVSRAAGQAKERSTDYMSRFEQLKRERAKQRAKAIEDGLMADPNQPTSLKRAITPTGTCTEMCPDYERVERIVQKMVDKSEKSLDSNTGELEIMESRMIKRFRRSAAGYDEQLPSDIRTPNALLQTLNYILRYLISDDDNLGTIHKFVWDRTRSIRNDLSIQQLTQRRDVEIAVKCLERIARFHIMSLHSLSNPANKEQFDHHQEREQLNNTLLSLLYYYDDNRGHVKFPHEDEFRAYYILFSIHDQRPDLEARVQKWPRELRQSPRIQVAMELFAAAGNNWEYQGTLDARRPNAIAQGFYSRFFNLIRSSSVPYLMACVAEIYFNQIRQTAIRSIWKAYCRQPLSQQNKNQEWTIGELTATLCFDDEDQTIKFCEDQDLELATDSEGRLYLDWGSRPLDSIAFQPSSQQIFSDTLVESKRYGRTLTAIILGMSVAQALKHEMIDKMLLRTESETDVLSGKPNELDSLFVSEDEGEKEIQINQATHLSNGIHEDETSSTSASLFSRPSNDGNGQNATNPFLKHLGNSFSASKPTPLSASASPFISQNTQASTIFTKNPTRQPVPPTAPSADLSVGTSSNFANSFSAKPTFGSSTPAIPFGSTFGTSSAPSVAPASDSPLPQAVSSPANRPLFGAPSTFSFGKPTSAQDVGASQNQKPLFSSLANTSASQTIKAGNFDPENTTKTEQSSKAPSFTFASTTSGPLNIANTEQSRKPFFPGGSLGQQPAESFQPSSAQQGSKQSDKQSPFFRQDNTGTPSTSIFSSPQVSQGIESAKPALQHPPFKSPAPGTFPAPSFPASSPFTGFSNQNGLESKASEPKFHWASPFGQPAKLDTQRETPKEKPPTAQTLQNSKEQTEDQESARKEELEQQALRERERKGLEEEELAKKEAARQEFERFQAARKEKQKKEAAEREAAQQANAMREQEEELKAAREEIQRREAMEKKAAEKEIARREAIEKEVIKRKALYDESEEESSSRAKPKVAKLGQRQTLSVEELLALEMSRQKTTPPKPRTERKSLIDEDELLFNAARMAGNELSRVRLFEGLPHIRESFSRPSTPSSTFSSSLMDRTNKSTRSASIDGLHATVNGYQVALAPQTPLGLGRSLSRTEQRIRQTGARGLAYKPIANLLNTPKDKGKQKVSKRKKAAS